MNTLHHIRLLLIISAIAIVMSACRLFYPDPPPLPEEPQYKADIDEEVIIEAPARYRGQDERKFNLVHTRLDVHPDWESETLEGIARITLTPHFYEQDSLMLDAKGFEINDVILLTDTATLPLIYSYNKEQISILLPETQTREDTFEVEIDYTAQPYNSEAWPEKSDSRDNGLHFITPEEHYTHVPRQMWTQGQPQSASSWFPTLGSPNQRSTQEIFITVDEDMATLSNGRHLYSARNPDGTRTDYWEQTLPHAPYLFMIAAGDFEITEDKWRNIDVNYLTEPKYSDLAEGIFGRTPEMLEFFSDITGIDYPWDKYHQIVVRNFMAGGMENTGAVTYFEAIQRSERERIDESYEYFLAHEAAHHWFGNLVSTNSWAEIFINEGPATYGAYLWKEHAYDEKESALYMQNEWEKYLAEASRHKKSIVNNYYVHPYENFNRHSYQKASLVLHYLRYRLGDEAFFAGLNRFLSDNAFQSADMHDFRHAFEAVSGRDLRLFFHNWFNESGHPVIRTRLKHDEENERYALFTEQVQDPETYPLFELPYTVRVHHNGEIMEYEQEMIYRGDTFYIPGNERPDLVEWDPDFVIPAERREEKSFEEWHYQFEHGSSIRSRMAALEQLSEFDDEKDIESVVQAALEDHFHGIRELAAKSFTEHYSEDANRFAFFPDKLKDLAKNDSIASVRENALQGLIAINGKEYIDVFEEVLNNDPSYSIMATALSAVNEIDPDRGLELSREYMDAYSDRLLLAAAKPLAESGDEAFQDFFQPAIDRMFIPRRRNMYFHYANYLSLQENPAIIAEHLDYWEARLQIAMRKNTEWKTNTLRAGLIRIKERAVHTLESKRAERDDTDEGSEKHERLTMEIYKFNEVIEELEAITDIK